MATLQAIRDQHQPLYSRRRTGLGAISGRPLWAWSVKCSCGWEKKTNQNKAGVEGDWKFHTREAWESQRVSGAEPPTTSDQATDSTGVIDTAPTSEPGMAGFLVWQARQATVKSCPCCAGKAHWKMGDRSDQKPDEVACSVCGLTMQGDFEPQSALAKWNTRVQQA